MSVIAWDGQMIATDNQSTSNGMRMRSCKWQQLASGTVLLWTGVHLQGLRLVEWWKNGARAEAYPTPADPADWCRLIVFVEGKVIEYEGPFSEQVTLPFMAWGAGRDFAMGALAAGASAARAVEIANEFCVDCGFGVKTFSAVVKR